MSHSVQEGQYVTQCLGEAVCHTVSRRGSMSHSVQERQYVTQLLECTECPYKVWDDLDKSVVRYRCFMCWTFALAS